MNYKTFQILAAIASVAALLALSSTQCSPKNVRQDNPAQDAQPKEQPKQDQTAKKEEKPKHADLEPLKEFCAARLKTAQEKLDLLIKAKGGAANDILALFDAMHNEIQTAEGKADVMANMHPDEDVRTAGMECVQTFEKFVSSFWLNRAAYDAFASIDFKKAGLDDISARLLKRVLVDFRREGVDKDAETRAKIEELKKREVELTQEYEKNIRDDSKTIKVKPEQLAGMPQDFLDSHKPGEDGLVKLTTDDPDYFPMINYCKDSDAKRELYKAWLSIAYPANSGVLRALLKTRCELAKLKGYPDYATFATEDKMIKTPQNAQKFIDEAAKKAGSAAKKMYARLLELKKKDDPNAKSVEIWEQHYLLNKIREAEYDYDSQEARKYFDIRKVKAGLFKVVETLYGVKITQAKDDKTVWHPDVESYDMSENGVKIAHFYFDIYPREGKVKSAAMFSLTPGIAGKQLPDGVLMANFVQPKGDEKALMEHIDVQTLFHEFGHLLHHLFSGVKARYVYFSGTAMEWDFVETPSQLFEEWAWRPEILKLFATDDAGNPLPEKLLEKMRKADALGRPLFASMQMFYAGLSLALYVGEFGDKSFDELEKKLFEKSAPYPFHDFMHYESGFWHLTGYASNYYTYMWSLVIAKDIDGAFAKAGYMNAKTAAKYRETILSRGGEKDAADLVKDFLGRQFSFDAFDAWLAGKD